jgi:RNA polymerase sigma factor FliA
MPANLLRTNPADCDHPLIEQLPMVRTVARLMARRVPQSVDVEDLFAAGLLGLVEAFHNFEPSKDVKFRGFANFRVRGAILDYLRTLDWAPRHLRRSGRAMDKAMQSLYSRLGHAPVEEQIAAEMKISLNDLWQLQTDLQNVEIGSLYVQPHDAPDEEYEVSVPSNPDHDPLLLCMREERLARLARAIDELPENLRLAVTLHYLEGMSQKEISVAMDRSPSLVSTILSTAVRHLRKVLADVSPEVAREPSTV